MKKLILLALVSAVMFAGCMSTIATKDGKLSYGDIAGQKAEKFTASDGYIYVIHPSLFVLGDKVTENLDAVMAPALAAQGANAATNLVIHDGFTVMDFLLTSVVPVLSWGTIEVEGVAVKQ